VLPKLKIETVHKLLCGLNCCVVIGTIEFNGVFELAIRANEVGLIMGYVVLPPFGGSAQNSQSPMNAENGAVIKSPYRNALPIDEQ
jgi:hypothetical protein